MEISQKLQKYKIHILVSLGLSVVVSSLILFVAPRFVTILTYFWPLLLSTALFLVAVVFFANSSAVSTELTGDKAAEGLLDYVAGESPLHHHIRHQINHHDNHDQLLHHDDDDHKVETSSSNKSDL